MSHISKKLHKKIKKTFLSNKNIIFFFTVTVIAIVFSLSFVQLKQNLTQQAATLSPSGEAMPTGDIPGWHQIFTDDFTTDVPVGSFPSAVSNKWDAYPDGWKDTSKNGTYYPSKVVSIQNGVMNLYLHTENGVHMVSAPEPKIPGATGSEGGLQYGRYVIRFKSDPVPGYKTAWLLWPDSETWPGDGEIDFPEGDLNSTIDAFMHRQNGTSGSDQDAFSTTATYTSWHTAVIEWSPTITNFILDGTTIGSSTSRIPNTPMHWVIQTETSLDSVPSNTAAGNVQIDWVAVYTPASTSATPTLSPTTVITATPTPTVTPTPVPTNTPTPTMTPAPITNLFKNGSFETGMTSWFLTVKGNAQATVIQDSTTKIDGAYAAKVNITRSSSTDWYIQLGQGSLPLTKARTYTISFWAKASKSRTGRINLQQDFSPWTGYLSQTFSLTTNWKQYTYTFTSPVTLSDSLFTFNLAQSTGQVWIDKVSMQ